MITTVLGFGVLITDNFGNFLYKFSEEDKNYIRKNISLTGLVHCHSFEGKQFAFGFECKPSVRDDCDSLLDTFHEKIEKDDRLYEIYSNIQEQIEALMEDGENPDDLKYLDYFMMVGRA